MKIKIIIMLSLLMVSIILITGCVEDKSDLDRLSGTWKLSRDNEQYTFDFYKNKSFYSYYIHLETEDIHEGWGTFEFNQSKLCMYSPHGASGSEEFRCYDYVFSQNNKKLILTSAESTDFVLVKIG